jgi:hypothetical protein
VFVFSSDLLLLPVPSGLKFTTVAS